MKYKHPIMLSNNGHIASIIIDFYRRRVGHGGSQTTINKIRNDGFWVIIRTAAIK